MNDSWTYRFEYVRCGKAGCRGCPHGPYWYRYQHRGGKMRKEYVGKVRPDQAGPEPTDRRGRPWDWFDEILSPGGRTLDSAFHCLGLPVGAPEKDCRSAFRRLSLEHHPDRGGDERAMKGLNAAWAYIRSYYRWK